MKKIILSLIILLSVSKGYGQKTYDYKLDKGFKGQVSFGYSMTSRTGDVTPLLFDVMAGHQFNSSAFFGGGVRLRHDPNSSSYDIPVFLQFRGHLTKTRLAPFLGLRFGYTVEYHRNHNDFNDLEPIEPVGTLIEPEAGATYALSPNFRILLAFNYEIQNYRVQNSIGSYGSLGFKLGIHFG